MTFLSLLFLLWQFLVQRFSRTPSVQELARLVREGVREEFHELWWSGALVGFSLGLGLLVLVWLWRLPGPPKSVVQ